MRACLLVVVGACAIVPPPKGTRPGPLELHPQPDLVIARATAVPTGKCIEGEAVLTIAVDVLNRGTSTSPATFVSGASMPDGGWGGGNELPPIAPGGTGHVEFAIGYPLSRPELVVKMTRFDIIVATPQRPKTVLDVVDPPCRPMPSLVAVEHQLRDAIDTAETARNWQERNTALGRIDVLRAEKAELARRFALARHALIGGD